MSATGRVGEVIEAAAATLARASHPVPAAGAKRLPGASFDARTAPGTVTSSARLDAEVLLAHVLDTGRAALYAWPEAPLEPGQRARFEALVERRATGEPVAYITGSREFWSMELEVTPATLIPRPETEGLVEACLDLLPRAARGRIADLGTGSGAVALALARERPGCHLVATDSEPPAVTVARRNARRLGLENVSFIAGSWGEAFGAASFDLIASNPPYVRAGDPHLTRGDVRFEPQPALVGGGDGLDALGRVVDSAVTCLAPGGRLVLEHGFDQGSAVRDRMRAAGLRDVETRRDHAGHERVTAGGRGN